jgi:hypothetical protein
MRLALCGSVMNMPIRREAAPRHRDRPPIAIARGEKTQAEARGEEAPRPPSETRLQAAVVEERPREDGDEYADVPCTD